MGTALPFGSNAKYLPVRRTQKRFHACLALILVIVGILNVSRLLTSLLESQHPSSPGEFLRQVMQQNYRPLHTEMNATQSRLSIAVEDVDFKDFDFEANLMSGATFSASGSNTSCCPILPLVSGVKYSYRPTSHLLLATQSIKPVGPLPEIAMKYLKGKPQALKSENLYPFRNYMVGYEGAVTHLWISILTQLREERSNHIVIDGGMNTGFYTTLSAVMEFIVHSFELQLDCFDVARLLLQGNQVDAKLYHIGISDKVQVILAAEGCNPSYNIANPRWIKPMEKKWKRRKHQVALLPLDTFLDETRGNKQIAILKLDVEGAEILALRGLDRHLPAVKNIIMEINPIYSRRSHVSLAEIQEKFLDLQSKGFRPFLLWVFGIASEYWFDATYLEHVGLRNVHDHPILGEKLEVGHHNTTILWEVVNWDSLFMQLCRVGCNLLFTRMAGNRSVHDISFFHVAS